MQKQQFTISRTIVHARQESFMILPRLWKPILTIDKETSLIISTDSEFYKFLNTINQ